MAETNAYPKESEILLIRADLKELLADGRTLSQERAEALKEVKRILEDDRGVPWSRVFNATADAYLDNDDSTGRNEDRIKNAISHMTASLIFRGYSVLDSEEENWSSLANFHYDMAKKRLLDSTLDIDLDDSGTIEDGEEGSTGQPFFKK